VWRQTAATYKYVINTRSFLGDALAGWIGRSLAPDPVGTVSLLSDELDLDLEAFEAVPCAIGCQDRKPAQPAEGEACPIAERKAGGARLLSKTRRLLCLGDVERDEFGAEGLEPGANDGWLPARGEDLLRDLGPIDS
jgi:hypothetical protein